MTDLKTRIETATKSLEASAATVEADVKQLKVLMTGTPADQAGMILTAAEAAKSSASAINSEAQRVAGIAADFTSRYLGAFDNETQANAAAVATKVVPPKAPISLQAADQGKLLAVKADASDYELVETIDGAKVSGKIKASQIDGKLPVAQLEGLLPVSQTSGNIPAERITGTLPSGVVGSIVTVPAGAVFHFAMASAPPGYLVCDGSLVQRALYAKLFAAIGTLYGPGDGSTTFQLPDLRGVFIRALDKGKGIDKGRVLDSKAQSEDIKAHTHSEETSQNGSTTRVLTYSGRTSGSDVPSNSSVLRSVSSNTKKTGSTGGDETRPINIALLACIKT